MREGSIGFEGKKWMDFNTSPFIFIYLYIYFRKSRIIWSVIFFFFFFFSSSSFSSSLFLKFISLWMRIFFNAWTRSCLSFVVNLFTYLSSFFQLFTCIFFVGYYTLTLWYYFVLIFFQGFLLSYFPFSLMICYGKHICLILFIFLICLEF